MNKLILFSLFTGLAFSVGAAHAAAPPPEEEWPLGFFQAPLVEWAQEGYVEGVERELAAGTDVNTRGEYETTSLMVAALGGHADVVRVLLEKGADVNLQDANGYTALMYAAKDGHKDIVQALLDAGADSTIINENFDTAADLATNDEIRAMLTAPKIKAARKR